MLKDIKKQKHKWQIEKNIAKIWQKVNNLFI